MKNQPACVGTPLSVSSPSQSRPNYTPVPTLKAFGYMIDGDGPMVPGYIPVVWEHYTDGTVLRERSRISARQMMEEMDRIEKIQLSRAGIDYSSMPAYAPFITLMEALTTKSSRLSSSSKALQEFILKLGSEKAKVDFVEFHCRDKRLPAQSGRGMSRSWLCGMDLYDNATSYVRARKALGYESKHVKKCKVPV